jgi:carbon-monoxide dehydrogenase small subunit
MTKAEVRATINGRERELRVDPWRTLLDVLREDLDLTGTKLGCEAGECGACTVLVDGRPVVACMTLAADADGREILTIEGISTPDRMHPLQDAFIAHSAFQCGYCAPGVIMSAKALLDENPHPDETEIRQAIAGNLCRCTAYVGIVKAIQSVAAEGVS